MEESSILLVLRESDSYEGVLVWEKIVFMWELEVGLNNNAPVIMGGLSMAELDKSMVREAMLRVHAKKAD